MDLINILRIEDNKMKGAEYMKTCGMDLQ